MTVPTREQVQAGIEAQVCPWCGRGAFKVLAQHTRISHGVDRFGLRELAGLPVTAKVCDPAYSERRAELDLDPMLHASKDWRDAHRDAPSGGRLTPEQVREIRRIYGDGTRPWQRGRVSRTELARRFGVTRRCIGMAIAGLTWRHVNP